MHGEQTEKDVSLMRVAAAALDGLIPYTRTNTYDEQEGEAGAEERARAASRALKLRLAAHVLDCGADLSRAERVERVHEKNRNAIQAAERRNTRLERAAERSVQVVERAARRLRTGV